MAKSDLATRPMFHFKETGVRTHVLTCFIALIMAKAIEQRTGLPLRAVVDELWKVPDARLYHSPTRKRITIRSNIPVHAAKILRKLQVPY